MGSAVGAIIVVGHIALGCLSPSSLHSVITGHDAIEDDEVYGQSLTHSDCYRLPIGTKSDHAVEIDGRVRARFDTDWWLWVPASAVRRVDTGPLPLRFAPPR
jgi:hypothetical protein